MIVSKYKNGNGGGGYVLPAATSSTLGGVKIGSGINVTADGTISANGGGKTVVNFDSTTQAERATLYTTLKALYDGGSGNTINDTYAFYKTINSNQGVPFDYYQFDSANTLILGAVVTSGNSTAYEQVLKIASDGSVTVSTNTIGGGAGKTVYKFNEMSQAELASMYAEITALPSATTNYNALYDFYNLADWNSGGMWRGWYMQGGYLDIDNKLCFSAVTIKENDMSQIYFFRTRISSDGSLENNFTEYHLS